MSEIDPFAEMDRRLQIFEANLAENTKVTQSNQDSIQRLEVSVSTVAKNTEDIVEFFQAGKGAFKFLGWIGTLAKWIGYIAAAFGSLYGAFHLAKTGINPADIAPK